MVDFKRLAQGRKGIQKGVPKKDAPTKPGKSLEQSCAEEVDEAAQAFRDRLEKEDKRKRAAVDSEFWFALCFTSRAEKEAFLKKYGLMVLGDKYLDGRAASRILGKRTSPAKDGHRKER